MGTSRYTFEERLAIGGRIYHGELNRYQAAIEYEISTDTCRNYMRMYRAKHNLPAKGTQEKAIPAEGENA
ncbi:MAG: hypothetical protein IJ418_18180 [Clostridia bacterium]|nr:hypothetical protein [Clostridia bacterium]